VLALLLSKANGRAIAGVQKKGRCRGDTAEQSTCMSVVSHTVLLLVEASLCNGMNGWMQQGHIAGAPV
jgi:hypothetical protein